MKKLLFVITAVSFYLSQALSSERILLVAHKDTPLADYKKICLKNNYLCLPQGYTAIAPTQTPHFNDLIENFDLDNKDYVSQFTKKLNLSLKDDNLNLEQLKNLILAGEKIAQNKDAKISEMVKRLKKIHAILTQIESEPADKMLYLLGKTVANNLRNRLLLDPYLQELKHLELDYVSLAGNGERKFFLNGECDRPRYTEFISQLDLQVIPHFVDGCNLSQRYDWGKDLMSEHLKENKNKYLLGLAAAATMFFLKTYDVSIGSE
jgi:hypothetical protein